MTSPRTGNTPQEHPHPRNPPQEPPPTLGIAALAIVPIFVDGSSDDFRNRTFVTRTSFRSIIRRLNLTKPLGEIPSRMTGFVRGRAGGASQPPWGHSRQNTYSSVAIKQTPSMGQGTGNQYYIRCSFRAVCSTWRRHRAPRWGPGTDPVVAIGTDASSVSLLTPVMVQRFRIVEPAWTSTHCRGLPCIAGKVGGRWEGGRSGEREGERGGYGERDWERGKERDPSR